MTVTNLNALFEQAQLRADAATSLAVAEGRLTLTPSDTPVEFESSIATEKDEIQVKAAIRTPQLVLVEANFYQQVHSSVADITKATDDDWMACVEWSIAAPGAQLGAVDDDGDFQPLPFYSHLQVLNDQTPMFYGQHMRCEPVAWTECMKFLRDNGYQVVDVGRSTDAPQRSAKRKSVAHLGAPIRETAGAQSYGTVLPQRVKSGLTVNRVVLLSNMDATREGFTDPLKAIFKNVERAAIEAGSADEQIKRNANRLVSSLTGITNWETDDHRIMKAPVRAGIADLTIKGEPFNFWTVSQTAGAPASNAPDPFAKQ